MQSQNLPNGAEHSKHYDKFMDWFKANYPNFFELYGYCIEETDKIQVGEVSNGETLSAEEQEFLRSIIDLYRKQTGDSINSINEP